MKTKVKKLSDSRVELTVTLDAKDLAPMREKALEKLAKEVKVEGFRKGKVPVEVAERFIPENDINAETIDRWVDEGWEWGKPISHEAFGNQKNPHLLYLASA